ncbi:DUF1929 domain-containing protein [Muricauda sp. SCSIO 64092]|uniref:LamG-like jellyroll fold domain-containing protein n=1 Tax=Allomuricauda sp. SCSIO 64092 TaxID=2908842 RepID=UPI001FF2974F|nr:LamG-like jellyroll fold domain-containing protein [Muricauda sp. SCSIO 64092]UOY06097.1 DUF1929 domain-containing protein [Muricauda sp. SCSIO 64092]
MKKNYTFQIFCITVVALCLSHKVNAQNPAQDGQWSDPVGFGLVPVAVANLPDGRLITWSSQFRDTYLGAGDGATFTEIFDPFLGADGQALGEFTSNTNHDMFCPGINNLPDGRILSAGGTSSRRTSIYDHTTGLWSVAPEMNIPRGYQGNVTLSDGSVFTIGGSWSDGDSPATNGNKDAEIWTPETGWVLIPGITGEDIFTANDLSKELGGIYRVDNHVWLWPAPNGQLFHAGPSEMMHWINLENGASITEAGLRADDTYSMKGTTVMFDVGRILKVGGAESYGDSDPAFVPAKDNSYVIDINNPSNVTVTPTVNNLSFSRTMHNSTVLPNGEVLVTGGLDRAEVFSDVGARLTAELYDPSTNSWRNVAGMATARTYHSVSILMVDGRVFVGGGGLCDNSNTDECVNHFDAEIYSPPYLFNPDGSLATRPSISAPDTADYNTSISVTGSSNINEFSLIRFSSATHSTNNEQRRIPVSFTGGGGSYGVNIPDRNLLPPGYYMLFAIDANGVPSVAEIIQIGNTIPLSNEFDLVLDLSFDEGSGNSIADSSGFGNDATIVEHDNNGNPISLTQNFWTSDGIYGAALEMDGLEFESNSIVDIPYSSSLATIEEEVTVMAWVYRDENEMNSGILSQNYPALFFGFHNSLYKWEFPTTGGSVNCYSGYVPTGRWVHMAATYDGQTGKLFANGVEICSQNTTGSFILETTDPTYSAFTSSGFYDVRTDLSPSGITDELDGRIDELKVYNRVLSLDEINAVFLDGQQQDPSVPVCPPGTIVAQYRIGTTGAWQTGNTVDVPEGEQVYIRAQVSSGEEYFVTTTTINGPTWSSVDDLPRHGEPGAYQIDTFVDAASDGIVGLSNTGQYTMTTASGCPAVINLNVSRNCGPGSTPIHNEYSVNGIWDVGASEITLQEGTELILSGLPDEVNGNDQQYTITLPDGTQVGDNYNLGNITSANAGSYTITSIEGCTSVLNVVIGTSDCSPGSFVPEYTLNGILQSGSGSLTVQEGAEVVLMAPVGSGTITLPDGTILSANHTIASAAFSDNGLYVITNTDGCSSGIYIDVQSDAANCFPGSIIPEYRVDGEWLSGSNDLNLVPGTELMLSMLPNGVGLMITLPDGTEVGDDYDLGPLTTADTGSYLLTSEEGCQTTINLTVEEDGCAASPVVPEYTLDGSLQSGAGPITVFEGAEVVLLLPAGPGTITLPDSTVVTADYTMSSAVTSDSGVYVFTNLEGCSASLDITVQVVGDCPPGSIIPEYRIDGEWLSGSNDLNLVPGTELMLSMLPNDIGVTITLPDGTQVGDDYDLGPVTASDSGAYLLTSEEGCQTTINLTVEEDGCTASPVVPGYTLDGSLQSGAGPITVFEGTEVVLLLPAGPGTITLPDSTVVTADYTMSSAVTSDSGVYVFTNLEGCSASLDITVQAVGGCPPGSIIPEYEINGEWLSGSNDLNLVPGTALVLSMLPNDIGVTITLPDGTQVGDNYDLGPVTASDSGAYLLTSEEGCQTTINLTVEEDGCTASPVVPGYTLDGSLQSGAGPITVFEGTEVVLLLPAGPGTITLPDSTVVTADYTMSSAVTSDSGVYVFTNLEGCSASLDITVQAVGGCPPGSIIPEYEINGEWLSGSNDLNLVPGTALVLSMLPNDIGVTITLPDGTQVGDNYDLGPVTPSDSGAYLLTSEEGCQTTINLTVEEDGCTASPVVPGYTLDGSLQSGAGPITVFEGTEVVLLLPAGPGTITLPDSTVVTADYTMSSAVTSDSGVYVFTNLEGCSASLDITVQAVGGCPPGSIIPEYEINGEWLSGSNDLNLVPGTALVLSMLPNDIGVTITLPDGTQVGDNYDLGQLTASDSGAYLLTSEEGCQTTLNLTVQESVLCAPGSIIPEYRINGEWLSGSNDLNLVPGTELVLSMLPNDIDLTITLPDGTEVGDNYDLGQLTASDSGAYLLTSVEGCQTTINLTVEDSSNLLLQTNSVSTENIVIYPNPLVINEELSLVMTDLMNRPVDVDFYDIQGRHLLKQSIPENHAEIEILETQSLSTGTYMILIRSTNFSTTRRFIKQ